MQKSNAQSPRRTWTIALDDNVVVKVDRAQSGKSWASTTHPTLASFARSTTQWTTLDGDDESPSQLHHSGAFMLDTKRKQVPRRLRFEGVAHGKLLHNAGTSTKTGLHRFNSERGPYSLACMASRRSCAAFRIAAWSTIRARQTRCGTEHPT